jgi:hypothetical protein
MHSSDKISGCAYARTISTGRMFKNMKFYISLLIIRAGILMSLKIKKNDLKKCKNDLKNSKNALKKFLQNIFKIA